MNPHIDHPSHAPYSVPAIQVFPARLIVVTALFNPLRYHSRYRLYRQFEKQVADAGAILITVEAAFAGRPFEVTRPDNPRHIQVRAHNEIWLKENLLNIGISRAPADAEYIATVDADVEFSRKDWPQETIQVLQHHAAAQMFSRITYLGPQYEVLHTMESFADRWVNGRPLRIGGRVITNPVFCGRNSGGVMGTQVHGGPEEYEYGHPRHRHRHHHHHHREPVEGGTWGQPGGAWAYRREALDKVGGLIDFSILGSADYHMAAAIIGELQHVITDDQDKFSEGYQNELFEWQRRAIPAFRKNLGVVQGAINHYWHGKMANRRYGLRNRILVTNHYDPRHDLRRDTNGVIHLHDDGSERFIRLRDDLRSYFAGRNEDSIDL